MKDNKTKGTWGVRLVIRFFTVVLGILVFWLLGFLLEDIRSVRGPEYLGIERKYVDQSLVRNRDQMATDITSLDWRLSNKRNEQRMVSDSSQNLQRTINQLLELQKLSIQKQVSVSEAEKSNLSVSLGNFLESQKSYQQLNEAISELTSKKLQLEEQKRHIDQQIEEQKKSATKEYDKLAKSHRLKLAVYQLLMLVPMLGVSGYFLIRKRSGIYAPLYLGTSGATLLKVGLVIHEYFPSRFFKYIVIIALLVAVAHILVHFIRVVAFPKMDWLIQQYREAYERFLCPVCEYPIRTGPRKFLYWTRRTVHKALPLGESSNEEGPYTCPACGTVVFERCTSCGKTRHALLPHCDHCGSKKEVSSAS